MERKVVDGESKTKLLSSPWRLRAVCWWNIWSDVAPQIQPKTHLCGSVHQWSASRNTHTPTNRETNKQTKTPPTEDALLWITALPLTDCKQKDKSTENQTNKKTHDWTLLLQPKMHLCRSACFLTQTVNRHKTTYLRNKKRFKSENMFGLHWSRCNLWAENFAKWNKSLCVPWLEIWCEAGVQEQFALCAASCAVVQSPVGQIHLTVTLSSIDNDNRQPKTTLVHLSRSSFNFAPLVRSGWMKVRSKVESAWNRFKTEQIFRDNRIRRV